MDQFFSKDFSYGPFVLFSFQHWAAILIVLAVNLILVFTRNRGSGETQACARKRFRYALAGILLLNELTFHIWNISTGQWTIQTMLPLHLCSVFVFLSAYMLIRRSYRVYEFAYFLGIAGAIQPIFTPDLGQYAFPHFRYFQVFLSHGGIVTAAIWMTVVEGFRPTWKSLLRTILYTNIYIAFVGLVNWAIGSNYLFIAHKPETASLIDVLGPWPLYILSLEGLGLVFFLLLYLPFAIRDSVSRRTARVSV